MNLGVWNQIVLLYGIIYTITVSLGTQSLYHKLSTLPRSRFQSTAPQRVALTAQTSAQKMTALWSCWLQTHAAQAPKLANTTIATIVAAVPPSPPFPPIPCPPCRASASVLDPKKPRLAAAHPALQLRRSDWSHQRLWGLPVSAPVVPCLREAGWRRLRPWSLPS